MLMRTTEVDYQARYLDLLKSSLCASLYDESAWRRITGPMKQEVSGLGHLKRILLRGIVNGAAKHGVVLIRPFKFNPELRQKGIDWPLFGFTMTGRNRLDTLQQCIETVLTEDVPGDIVETGVWRGGSMILAAALTSDRRIWCCDSFEGMPIPTVGGETFSGTEDFSDLDYLAVSLEQVQENFQRYGLLSDRIQFLKGWFSDTLPKAPIKQIALLRLDGDLYESTRDALEPLYPKVSKGGFVIVDDYNSWDGCKKAVTEYREQHGITAPLIPIDNAAVYWRV